MGTSDISARMKEYEKNAKTTLMKRTPVVVRVDGRGFSKFTKKFEKPFDKVMTKTMQQTMKYLCENIPGCVLGYTQSDEITLVLVDYDDINKGVFFDYDVQKLCSVIASMCTMSFNRNFAENVNDLYLSFAGEEIEEEIIKADAESYLLTHERYSKSLWCAMFDCRVFNVPKDDVTNCIYWRQVDATRNSIQAAAYANFSTKEIDHKNTSQMQDMLMLQKGINWNNYPTESKRGSCCIKKNIPGSKRKKWEIDREIPIFKGDGREYIEKLINF